MGLSSFNAMRARQRAEAEALAKAQAGVEVHEVKPVSSEENPDERKPQKKRTDAEKLKKKE